jgi:hypothetical protein
MSLWSLFFPNANAAQEQQRRFIENYEFRAGLRQKFAGRHSHLTREQQTQVFEALREYFLLCHASPNEMVSMPSLVVDDAWHEFILFTRDYLEFCQQAFGRYLHHTPAYAMKSSRQERVGIRRTWKLACQHERINPREPHRLPNLFAIDGALAISGGFIYSLDAMALNRRNASQNAAGCGGAGGCGGSGGSHSGHGSGDCGPGSSDGGCGDGGSSCGGGCGGGCGGS